MPKKAALLTENGAKLENKFDRCTNIPPQRAFYQHLIQFLIALAVGTLAGDALLHLLPHALLAGVAGHHTHAAGGGGDDDDDDAAERRELHKEVVWKGFVVIVALIAFFFCEKMINAVGEWKQRQNRIKVSPKRSVEWPNGLGSVLTLNDLGFQLPVH